MKSILRLAGLGVLAALLGYCVFGMFATFESLPAWQRWVWRTAYALVGLACGIGLARPCRCWHRLIQRGAMSRPEAEK